MNTNLNPFYIYTTDDILYIKDSNQNAKRLANNIKFFCANVDEHNKIHICAMDHNAKIIHFLLNKNNVRKYTIGRFFDNIKNILEMNLTITKDFLNLFITQKNSLSENTYRISHLNFSPSNYKVNKHLFNCVYKKNNLIYKLYIDDLSNIIFTYSKENSDEDHTFLFNYVSRKWISFNPLVGFDENFFIDDRQLKNIQSDLFDYLYSIKYKL